jgi:hypothetical protein
MNAYTEHAAGLKSLQDELGTDCPAMLYAGRKVKVLPGSARIGSNNTLGGQMLEWDLSLTCLATDFHSTPQSNQPVVYPYANGRRYAIDSVSISPNGLQYTLKCTAANKV